MVGFFKSLQWSPYDEELYIKYSNIKGIVYYISLQNKS